MKHRLPALLLSFLLAAQAFATDPTPPDLEYRMTAVVRDFDAPGLKTNRGQFAAEVVRSAMQATGLVETLRPKYREVEEYTTNVDALGLDDIRRDRTGKWTANPDALGSILNRAVRREEISLPAADFIVEGTVGKVGEQWWIKATLRKPRSNKTLAQATETAQPADFFTAAWTVGEQVATPCLNQVLERRTEAILRAVNGMIMTEAVAAKELESLHKSVPPALSPCAARLALIVRSDGPAADRIAWGLKTAERVADAGPDGLRYLLRLDVQPFTILARAYEAEGQLDKAADAHRAAVQAHTHDPFGHWIEALRLEAQLGRKDRMRQACRAALKLRPDDARLQKMLAALEQPAGQ